MSFGSSGGGGGRVDHSTLVSPAEAPEFGAIPQRQLIADYGGQPFVDAILNIGADGTGNANANLAAAVQGLQQQAAASGQSLDQVMAGLGFTGSQIEQLNTNLGGAFDTTGAQDAIGGAAAGLGGAFDTSGARDTLGGIDTNFGQAFDTSGARDTLGGIDTDLGQAFDTTGSQTALTDMDYRGIQDRYESQYVDGMVNPALARMREDEARRMAELEASGAAIGGGSNTRMAVEMARTTDEGTRSRAEMEANLRNQALRQGQELGLQEAGMRGQFSNMAAQLGLSESELNAAFKERGARTAGDLTNLAAQLGLSESELDARIRESGAQAQGQFADLSARLGLAEQDQAGSMAQIQAGLADMAARLGMSESELQASIMERQTQLGLDQASAMQSVLNDMGATAGQQFGMQESVAGAQQARAAGNLDAARLGMTAAGIGLEQSELQRQIQTEQNQAPLTMEAWYRNMVGTPLATPLPQSGTQTQSGGGPGVGTQVLGAGTSLLGAAMMGGLISDERAKTDIEPLEGALDIIRRQRPSSYSYIDPQYDRVPEPGRRSAGLMAQDLEDIPGAVMQHESGYRMVDPYPVMATIAAAVQELDRKVEGMSHV